MMPIENKTKTIIIVAIAIFVMIAGSGFWYWQKKSSVSVSSERVTQTPADQKIANISLGSQILERTQDILKNKFPETNPLKQIIINPFR